MEVYCRSSGRAQSHQDLFAQLVSAETCARGHPTCAACTATQWWTFWSTGTKRFWSTGPRGLQPTKPAASVCPNGCTLPLLTHMIIKYMVSCCPLINLYLRWQCWYFASRKYEVRNLPYYYYYYCSYAEGLVYRHN